MVNYIRETRFATKYSRYIPIIRSIRHFIISSHTIPKRCKMHPIPSSSKLEGRKKGRKKEGRRNTATMQSKYNPPKPPSPSPQVHSNQPDNLQSQVMTSHGRVCSLSTLSSSLPPAAAAALPPDGGGWRERGGLCLGEGRGVRAHPPRCSGGHPPERSGSHSWS